MWNPMTCVSGFQTSDVRLTSPAPGCKKFIIMGLLHCILSSGVQPRNVQLCLSRALGILQNC